MMATLSLAAHRATVALCHDRRVPHRGAHVLTAKGNTDGDKIAATNRSANERLPKAISCSASQANHRGFRGADPGRLLNAAQRRVDGAHRHPELRRHLGHRQPVRAQVGKTAKVQLDAGTAQLHPAPPRPVQSGPGALTYPNPFLLSDPAEDGDQQGPDRTTRVEPRFPQADDLDSHAVEVEDRLQCPQHGPVKPVQGPHDDNLEAATVRVGQEPVELGPGLRGRHLLAEGLDDLELPGSGEAFEVGKLVVEALVLGRDSEVDGGFHMTGYERVGAWSTT